MDHEQVEKDKIVERFLLGDLSEAQREGFERHFFDCPLCSEDMRIAEIFRSNALDNFLESNE